MRTVITDRAGCPYSVQLLTIVLVFIIIIIIIIIIIGRSTLVGQRPMKSLSSVCPAVHPSNHDFCKNGMVARIWVQGFSCRFLDFASLLFLDNAYNDSLQQCLTSSRCKVYEKTKLHILIACNTV